MGQDPPLVDAPLVDIQNFTNLLEKIIILSHPIIYLLALGPTHEYFQATPSASPFFWLYIAILAA